MRRVVAAGKYLLLTLLCCLGILLVLLFNADLGGLAPFAENTLSQLLNRKVVLDGPSHIRLDVDGRLAIETQGIRLASTGWSTHPELLSVDRLKLEVQAWSLLRHGPLIIEHIGLDNARLRLETNGAGEDNWTLFPAADEPPDTGRASLPVLTESIAIRGSEITLQAPQLKQTLRIRVDELRQSTATSRAVDLTLAGQLNEEPIGLKAQSPNLDNLVDMRNVALVVAGQLGEVELDGNVFFDDLLAPGRPTADVSLKGPNAEYLLDLLNLRWRTAGPLNLTLDIAPEKEQLALTIKGRFGEYAITSSGVVSALTSPERIDLKYHVSGPDLSEVGALLEIPGLPPERFEVDASTAFTLHGQGLVECTLEMGDATLLATVGFEQYPDLATSNASLQLKAPELSRIATFMKSEDNTLGPLDGLLTVVPRQDDTGADLKLEVTTDLATIAGHGMLSSAPGHVGSVAEITLENPDAGPLTAALGIPIERSEPLSVRLSLEKTTSGFDLSPSTATIGEDQLHVAGSIGEDPLEAGTRLQIDAQGPDFTWARSALGVEGLGAAVEPYRLSTSIEVSRRLFTIDRLDAHFGDQRARLSGTLAEEPLSDASRLVFDISLPSLTDALHRGGFDVEDLPVGSLAASGVLQGAANSVSLQGIELSVNGADAKLEGRLLPADNWAGSHISLRASGEDMNQLLPALGPDSRWAYPFTLSGEALVDQGQLKLVDARIATRGVEATLNASSSLEQLWKAGQFAVTGQAADLHEIYPSAAAAGPEGKLPASWTSNGSWRGGVFKFDEMVITSANGQARVTGTLTGPPYFDNTKLSLTAELPDASRLTPLLGQPLPADPFRMAMQLRAKRGEFTASKLSAQLGVSDLSGGFSFRPGDPMTFNGKLHSRLVDITALLPPPPDAAPEATPGAAPEATPAAGQRAPRRRTGRTTDKVIPDTPLPVPQLGKLSARLGYTIDELKLDAHTLRKVTLDTRITGGELAVDRIAWVGDRGGRFTASGSLRPVSETAAMMKLQFAGRDMIFGFPALTEQELRRLPQYDLEGVLQARGATVRELAAGANGYLRLMAGKGRIRAGGFRLLTNDFIEQLLETVNPFTARDPYTKLKCAVVLAGIENGRVVGEPFLVSSSERLNVYANADIDLRRERLDVTFNTVPQRGLGLSVSSLINPYVKLTGTLAAPLLLLDPEQTIIEGTATVVTGGLNIIARTFRDRYLSGKDPCGEAHLQNDERISALEEKYGKPPIE